MDDVMKTMLDKMGGREVELEQNGEIRKVNASLYADNVEVFAES